MNQRVLIAISSVVVALAVAGYFLFRPSRTRDDVVRIGILKHESSLPFYVADEFGLFEAHNSRVELVELPPGDHVPALLSGRVDILSPTSFPVLFGVMYQHPGAVYAVLPGAEVSDGPTVYGFVVRNDFPGTGLGDLQGRVVMAINPYTQVNIQTILASAGIPRSEWPDIRVAGREAALAALTDGTVQATIMDQPALAVALASGDYRLLEANPRARHIGSPYWSGAGAVTCARWAERRDDFLRLMAAVDAALARIASDPEAAHRVLARRLGIAESVASQMGGYYFPNSDDPVPLQGIRATVEALVSAGLLPGRIELSDFFPPGLYGR